MNEREQDFEAKYAHDQEILFRIEARRNKLLGHWAAEKLGLVGAQADAYAQDVIRTAFLTQGDDGSFDKVHKDFVAAKIEQSEHQIRRTMAEMLLDAEKQIHDE